MGAALGGHDELCSAILEREDFTTFDAVDRDRATALHLATGTRHVGCVLAIISSVRFTAVNARDMNDRTPLHLAALRADPESYEAILCHPDCCADMPDGQGRSAAEYAAERGLDVGQPAAETAAAAATTAGGHAEIDL